MNQRKIIHIDMDCFFVAVELRERPELRGKPVAVGGDPNKRGVIATCSYEAREFGVHSALSSARAMQRCPDLVILQGHMDQYKAVSNQLCAIFRRYTDVIEPLSLDEAYLDVTDCMQCRGSATLIAEEIRRAIWDELQLTASAGVGPNKLIAKIASDMNKPDGIFVVAPDDVEGFIRPLSVSKLFGVGKATLAKLNHMGINTCADLQQCSLQELTERFGKFGNALYSNSRGVDQREVRRHRIRKSVSVERTYAKDLPNIDSFATHIDALLEKLQERLTPHHDRVIKSVFVKLKFKNFQQTTAETQGTQLDQNTIQCLLQRAYQRQQKPVRLLGIGVHFAAPDKPMSVIQQMPFAF